MLAAQLAALELSFFPQAPFLRNSRESSSIFGASFQSGLPLPWPSYRSKDSLHATPPPEARHEMTPPQQKLSPESATGRGIDGRSSLNRIDTFSAARRRGGRIRNVHCHAIVSSPEGVIRREDVQDEDGEVLIECKDVYKSFGDKHILKGASFKIRHGEAVGIIGPSGTGKSTILRIMAGLLSPDKGEVWVCGKKREGLISDEDNPPLRIGMVFQSAALFDSLTVRENVGFMLYEHSDIPEDEILRRVTESLKQVGLYNVEERVPSELSGGMKKRVALARAIISDAKEKVTDDREVVMYDEPTAGLDPIASTVVEDLIRSLHVKSINPATREPGTIASYIVVTHQHSTIRRAVDRLLFLHEGKVVWEGLTSEFDTSLEPIVRQFAEGNLKGPIKY